MALGDIAGEVLEAAGRVVGRILIEALLEVLVKGPGYFIARLFRPRVDPDGLLSLAVGVAFWVLVGFAVLWGWRSLAAQPV